MTYGRPAFEPRPERDEREKREGGEPKEGKAKLATRITQQFRERHNMTYELDCDGVAIVIRMFPPDDVKTSDWRFEARASATEGNAVTAVATTRRQAIDRLAQACLEQPSGPLSQVDWRALVLALESVRAL